MKPVLKLYRGYANENQLLVMGHVFKPTTKADYDFQKTKFRNARSVIRMFRQKTASNFDVYFKHDGRVIHTKTLDDGFFQFCIPLDNDVGYGWITYEVSIKSEGTHVTQKGSYIRPFEGNLGFISDIDDTFLISHSRNIFKKLYILLFKNVNDRKIFSDVVAHYQALSTAGRNNKTEQNAFFYVSSSEWNLYRFIVQFAELHQLPRAVLLLKDIKQSLFDFLITGRGNHDHKFEKIKHILEFYPKLNYTLLGDDSQQDAELYERICKMFPVNVQAVYIRQTGKLPKQKVTIAIQNMSLMGVHTCYFTNSKEAIAHSKSIGLIV
ncbi:App1 family protein [Flavobacterium aurantiibacter]|uniref:Phosphatidate phosphatase APP1 catalytic domain-containing protein n=1 Tax=Flavobacterium aurantiibacter TaxID=2023067 RepID=A0A256A256_9FLAO|nr:App1 family protein [Flavobacterium aurantiibacter]OYQ47164.1 hypothetical protein CHX27_03525 [Flavobacterium aurantiibacter]